MRRLAVLAVWVMACAETPPPDDLETPDSSPPVVSTPPPDASPPATPDAAPEPQILPTKWTVKLRHPEGPECTGTMLLLFLASDGSSSGTWTCTESALDAHSRRLYGPAANIPQLQYDGSASTSRTGPGKIAVSLELRRGIGVKGAGTIVPPDIIATMDFGSTGSGVLTARLVPR